MADDVDLLRRVAFAKHLLVGVEAERVAHAVQALEGDAVQRAKAVRTLGFALDTTAAQRHGVPLISSVLEGVCGAVLPDAAEVRTIEGIVTLDFLGQHQRTHMCGDLRAADAGQKVTVMDNLLQPPLKPKSN